MTTTHVVAGLAADPDYPSIARVTGLAGRYRADASGGVGPGGRDVIGYDRGDAGRTFSGPVYVTGAAAAAYGVIAAPANVYNPGGTVQDALSNDPALTGYRQLLYNRMIGGH